MKKTAIKITLLIGMVIVISLAQLAAAGESIKADFNPDESYVCRVGESLILDLPETTAFQVDTANNPNWKLIKELNFIWLIPNKPDDVLVLTVTNYNGDKIVAHITSKSKEELPENPIKRLVIKQFPHKEIPQYATEISTVKTDNEPAQAPAADPQVLMAEKLKKEEEIKKQKIEAGEKLWKDYQKQQIEKKDKQQEEERLAKEAQELKEAKQAESDRLKKEEETRLKQDETDRLQEKELLKKQEEERLAKEVQEQKKAEQLAQNQQQAEEIKEADKIIIDEAKKGDEVFSVNTEAVKTEKPVEEIVSAQQKTDDKSTEKKETEISKEKKKIDFLVDVSGGSYNINKESRASFAGEIVAAKKSNAGIIAQFAFSANVNNFAKKYGQSIGIGIEKGQAGIGYFAFLDSLLLKTDQYKMTFHYQIRPAIRFKNNRFAISGFAALALSKAQYTGIDDPEDPNLGVFNTALSHYGVSVEGIIIPRKLFIQFEGAFAESKAYRLLLGIEYGITKKIGIYLKGIKTSYGDQPLLTNEQYGNDLSIQAGLKFESNRADLDKRNQIIFPRDYPLVANVKKDNNKNIEDKLTITLTANPKTGKSPLSVEFTAVLSGGKSPYILNWTYGNQSQENVNNVTIYTYTKVGTYNAFVTVKDSLNQTAISNTETITVTDGDSTSHTILASAGPGGNIDPSGSVIVADGGNQSFHVSASSGYKISSVKIDGNSQGAAEGQTVYDYTFSNVTYDRTISAQFESQGATTHTILASAGAGGSINPSGTVVVTHGGNQSFHVSANSGYKIDKLKVDGNDQSAAEGQAVYDYPFTNVIVNHEIAATFSAILLNYTVTVSAGANGSITPGTSTYAAGSNASFSVQPSTGYKISQILLDGANYSISNELGQSVDLTNIQANHTLSATFSIRTFTIIISNEDPSAGWTDPSQGTYTVNYGSNFTIHSVPNSGFAYRDCYIDGVLNNLYEYYTFSNITANHTYFVRWQTGSYTVTVSLSYHACGTVTPGTSSYNAGDTAAFWIEPCNPAYPITCITLDGVPQTINNPYTPQWFYIYNIHENHTLYVCFPSI